MIIRFVINYIYIFQYFNYLLNVYIYKPYTYDYILYTYTYIYIYMYIYMYMYIYYTYISERAQSRARKGGGSRRRKLARERNRGGKGGRIESKTESFAEITVERVFFVGVIARFRLGREPRGSPRRKSRSPLPRVSAGRPEASGDHPPRPRRGGGTILRDLFVPHPSHTLGVEKEKKKEATTLH